MLRLAGVERTFVDGGTISFRLQPLSLEIVTHESFAILGPSGSGKTTLLRLIAGLERVDAGRIFFDDRDVTSEPPERRAAGVVFAEDALFPHMSAYDNIAYGVPRGARERVTLAAKRMRVDGLLERAVETLSGGERQRVALARALAYEPALLLLDEPLGRLDVPLRAALRLELSTILRERRYTTVLVTHDQSEAMALGDRIAVMNGGTIEQVGSPRDLYERPANVFVAGFVGSPAMALVDAAAFPHLAIPGATRLGVRAAGVSLSPAGDVSGLVRAIEDLGAESFAYCDTAGGTLVCSVRDVAPTVGERVLLALDAAHVHAFDAGGRRIEQFARV